jgi:hypothetical protein
MDLQARRERRRGEQCPECGLVGCGCECCGAWCSMCDCLFDDRGEVAAYCTFHRRRVE